MASRILVSPIEDFFVAFLATRGITVTADNPEVIHFFGFSPKVLKNMVKEKNPDLVVIHDPRAFEMYKFPFAMDDIKCDRDIYVPRQIVTNAPDLVRMHYQSLGLERSIHDITEKKKEEKETLSISANTVKRVFNAMMWD